MVKIVVTYIPKKELGIRNKPMCAAEATRETFSDEAKNKTKQQQKKQCPDGTH